MPGTRKKKNTKLNKINLIRILNYFQYRPKLSMHFGNNVFASQYYRSVIRDRLYI